MKTKSDSVGQFLNIRLKSIPGNNEVVVIAAAGCLDATTRDSLTEKITDLKHRGFKSFIFDFRDLFYLSSSGIDPLVTCLKTVTPSGGDVILTAFQERVSGVLKMYGFGSTFKHVETVNEALKLLGIGSAITAEFPIQLRCPSCNTSLTILEPGKTDCDNCGIPLQIDKSGKIFSNEAEPHQKVYRKGLPLPPVQVMGQNELIEHLKSGGKHHSHCISIGNPRGFFTRTGPDKSVPEVFRTYFKKILRLSFYDVEEKRNLTWRQLPRRIPKRSDVKRLIRFFQKTQPYASGYTIHCWQGVSRSTAAALAYLYMITKSEDEAKRILMEHRPEAGPHQKLVKWFDEELGCNLTRVADEIRKERFDRWRKELEMTY